MKRFKPGLFRQNAPRPKKKNKSTAGMTNPVVQRVLDKAIRDAIGVPDQMANNYMNTKFPDDAPLSFLGDNNINSEKWPLDSFNAHQLDYVKALEDANNRLGIETAASVTKAVDESYIGNWHQRHKAKAALEADLALVERVVEMTWNPANYEMEENQEHLDGHYMVKVQRNDGHFEYVKVTTDWVERNFKKSAIGAVQRVAYEKLEVMEDGGNLLTKTQKQGYLKVEIEGVQCSETDRRVINRLKYKKAYSTIKAAWFGYSNQTKAHIPLENKWVVLNFPKSYVKQVKVSSGRTASYVKIPPGDRRCHSKNNDNNGPLLHYQQKDDERTCMVLAMASIMHYSGDTSAGAWMKNRFKRYLSDPAAFQTFVKDIRHHVKLLKSGATLGKHFDILGSGLSGIYLAQVQGSDGKEDHCVAVSDKWIFDTNYKNALPRSQESLDMCCSSDEEKSLFVMCINVEHFPKVVLI